MVWSTRLQAAGPSLPLSPATLASRWLSTTLLTIRPTQARAGRVRIADLVQGASSVGKTLMMPARELTSATSGLIQRLTPCPRMPRALETVLRRAQYVDLDTQMWA